jgi:hypothetical protein
MQASFQVIRGVINLAISKIEFDEEQQEKQPNGQCTFSVFTSHRAFLMQPLAGEDVTFSIK